MDKYLLPVLLIPIFVLSLLGGAIVGQNLMTASAQQSCQTTSASNLQGLIQLQKYDAMLYAFNNPNSPEGQIYNITHPFSFNAYMGARAGYTICGPKDSSANAGLLADGFTPSCLTQCNGVLYFKDPTTVITNEGHDYIQYIISGTAHSVTPGTTDRAKVEGVSTSNSSAAVTDTYAGSGPCSSGTILTTSGFAAAAGTVTAGTPSAGSVTWTIVETFTSAAYKTISAGCLLTATSGSIYIFGESSGIGHFGIPSGDTLSETWQVTAT